MKPRIPPVGAPVVALPAACATTRLIPTLLLLAPTGASAATSTAATAPPALASVPRDFLLFALALLVLLAAIGANVWFNLRDPAVLDHFPVIGCAVLLAVLVTAPLRRPTWALLPGAFKSSLFLLGLVCCASLMPVDALPAPSWPSALGLGFVSAVFDNIPLTALAIRQDGFDWGFLAYAVGFGGLMMWFGSSAGVALAGLYPDARSVWAWVRGGWHVVVAYVLGFFCHAGGGRLASASDQNRACSHPAGRGRN